MIAEAEALLAHFTVLAQPRGLAQLAVLAIAFALALLGSRWLRPSLRTPQSPGIRKIGAGSANRLLTPVLFLALAAMGALALSRWQPIPQLKIGLVLIASFVGIRLCVYLLRHLLAPSALLKASERVVAYSVWALVALHFTGILPEINAALAEVKFSFGKHEVTLLMIVSALLSVMVTLFMTLSVSSLIEARVMRVESIDMSTRVFVGKLLRAIALVLAVLIALPLVGIDLTLLSVFGGALGVGLGLGLQKIASNYLSGFIILLDRSVRLGDLITVDNRHGVVKAIKARYTVVRALDGTESIIPNDTLITNTVVNHTYTDPLFLVKVAVSVAYDTDLDLAKQLMVETALAHSRVLSDPAPDAQITALADSGINLELSTWIRDVANGQGALKSDLLQGICTRFRAAQINIPFPQREVRIVTVNADASATRS